MMEFEFRDSYVSGVSVMAARPQDLLDGSYDFSLIVSSWDSRCLCVTDNSTLSLGRAVLLLFTHRDPGGLRDRHDRLLTEYADRAAESVKPVCEASTDLENIRHAILRELYATAALLKRPLRVFLDLSTCPRYYALDLLATCMKHGMAAMVSIFYAEGKYPEEENAGDPYELFTVGGWNAVPIPALRGDWDPTKRRSYLVSVGFEGAKTLRLISRAEPDRVSILFPEPGVQPFYADRTRRNNHQLLHSFGIPAEQIVRAAAGDAVAAWKALSEAALERAQVDNVYYVCCGTKPHSVALALRALSLGYPAVLYIVPDRHKAVDVSPTGTYWRFDIRDVTSVVQ